MGKIGFVERLSFKKQLILTFVWIMVLSVICTIITIVIGGIWIAKNTQIRPANSYEKQIPNIIKYVRTEGAAILDPKIRPELEQRIPAEGIRYQVVDTSGTPLYGTLQERQFQNKESLIESLNTTSGGRRNSAFGGMYTRCVPVITAEGDYKGAILLRYKLEVSTAPESGWINFAIVLYFVISPFLYIALFTYLFAGRFGKRIARPVHDLIEASKRIQDQDLDFTVSYKAHNELGMLTESFENMRSALKSSLIREWKLEQERRDMMDAIAHDFRTPMTVIQGNVELLADTPEMPRSQAEGHLKVIEDNIKRVNRLIQDIQVASEKDIEYFPLRSGEVCLQDFLQDKKLEIEYICSSRHAEYSFDFVDLTPNAGGTLFMDVQRVSQVLDNLISNSLRYLPQEGGWIGIRIERHVSALLFEICDNGPGFNDKAMPRLFEKFYRGEKGQSGLGLYTAKIIAEKHGGNIRAYNRQEGGARMTFTIRTQGQPK
ncbi:HAMP domain-containing sensor histidine kinase [Paenibacillus sp.]|jgi:signal transduction histidine kinase|uniref:HAMP domain-containing sensor histidine kinase n=1 Tax=Paenibacillus sp. TaxID=58172 RepID=UPI00281C387F|nr:HAMP domain-containing sensor histidine kinase [Paenibacillus sp.]MDR0270899.1 HAMP domain-containing histidine kinase [Paenibacillus sp.]